MSNNLFSGAYRENLQRVAPLADRMRPRTLAEFEEQIHILGPGSPLRRAIKADVLQSLVLWGPPGTGKTSLATIIANTTSSNFEIINAVTSGVHDIRRVLDQAKEHLSVYNRRTVVFIDEIHRFNKLQQDALLPSVEQGLVILIGSTTENPMFSVNRPLLSRSRLYRLEPLTGAAVRRLLVKAIADSERGLGNLKVDLAPGALDLLADSGGGDARIALNNLEFAVRTTAPDQKGVRKIDLEAARAACGPTVLNHSREDEHYDVVSAWIKSMRGSDPQATLYWLARLIYAGEDPAFLARRLMIHAAEDVGLADPQALVVSVAAAGAVERVGLPEGRIILAEAALYIARAPKSNSSVVGIDRAMAAVRQQRPGQVPAHLRDTSYRGAASLGHGLGYKYPHDYPGHKVEQDYLPPELGQPEFYLLSGQGKETDFER